MKVRQHRGSFSESMGTAAEVTTQAQLDCYFGRPVTIGHRVFHDDRNGWDTHYVLDSMEQCVGMSDGMLMERNSAKQGSGEDSAL